MWRPLGVEVVVEATGEIEYGARVSLAAIAARKHLVLVNAELDATLGPILKVKADEAGVVFTDTDGDQPGALMNLMREAEFRGFQPAAARQHQVAAGPPPHPGDAGRFRGQRPASGRR